MTELTDYKVKAAVPKFPSLTDLLYAVLYMCKTLLFE